MNISITAPRVATAILLIAVLAFAFFFFNTRNDDRNLFHRMGDAVEELPDGAGQAADQMKDRSPAQKFGDAIEDAGENMKRSAE